MRCLIILPSLLAMTAAQAVITSQNDTFNSSFAISSTAASEAGINSTIAIDLDIALEFEQTNWATGSVESDPFYADLPANASTAPAGSILKIEQYTNTSLYTLPPNTALSRIVFQSETINGSTVPASAYAVVSWAHGTSGVTSQCAPSHIRNLWYQFSAPYILALQGYVVVAPDYAGLGINHFANGTKILHPYLNNVAHANDLVHAAVAAQQAWPDVLSSFFVTMGHSQGGGAAWGVAQRQAKTPVPGYLGTVAGSPVTSMIASNAYEFTPSAPFLMAMTLNETLPGFNISDFLTPQGIASADLLASVGGCNSAEDQLLLQDNIINLDWANTTSAQLFTNLTANGGGRAIAGPMLVLQGTADPAVFEPVTSQAVNETCAAFPQSQIEYAMFEGVSHVPVLNAGQRLWLDWIADRFAGKETGAACQRMLYEPAWGVEAYQTEVEYFLELATEGYEVA